MRSRILLENLLELPAIEPGGLTLPVVDMHTAGEPVRILDARAYAGPDGDILAKRRRLQEQHDWIRKTLMLEPRGHSEMYGAFMVEPSIEGADVGVLFTHGSGYSTMCGHATIALGRLLHDAAARTETPRHRFRLECPCGPVDLDVDAGADSPITSFLNVESFAAGLDQVAVVPGYGEVEYDLGYGGAYYAILPAASLGLDLLTSPVEALAEASGALVGSLRSSLTICHPGASDLAFLYGAIVTAGDGADPRLPLQNLCWFGEGQLDRSPTGSGVAARLAVDHAKGRIGLGECRRFAGLSGDCFEGIIAERTRRGVRVRVRGRAFYVGRSDFRIEVADPFGAGLEVPAAFAARPLHLFQQDEK